MRNSITELLWDHAATDGHAAIVYGNPSTFGDECK